MAGRLVGIVVMPKLKLLCWVRCCTLVTGVLRLYLLIVVVSVAARIGFCA